MAAKAAFTGALSIAGFAFPFKAYSTVKSVRNESFKTLCKCHGEPIAQKNTCRTSGDIVDTELGVEVSKDKFRALPTETIEAIRSVGSSTTLEPLSFPPLTSVPLALATGSYRIIADPKAAGSAQPVATLWRVLRKTDLALETTWIKKAGTPDQRLVIWSDHDGLRGHEIPWSVELNVVPTPEEPNVVVPDAQVALFERAIQTLYPNDPFALDGRQSEYKARRADAIAKALDGKPIEAPAQAAAEAVPDLMAALSASLQAANTKEPIAA